MSTLAPLPSSSDTTTVQWVQCLQDSDCPPKNNTKGKCDSPYGSDNPATSGYTYTCWWSKCSTNNECVSNACCDRDPSIPSVDQGSGSCYASPYIYKNKYLCVS